MTKKRFKFRPVQAVSLAARVSLSLILVTTISLAQTDQQDLTQISLEGLMNLQVRSVSKKDQKLSNTAAAVYVITREEIRRSGVTSIPEALRLVPGVNVARVDSNRWAISIRGFNGIYANKLLVLVDGRSVYSPTFAGVYWDMQDTVIEDIERIEVIRGPGATMWGANAVNGVINILTRHASETQGVMVTSGFGTEERGFGSVRYGGQIGQTGHYRVYSKYVNRDSFTNLEGNDNRDRWDVARGGFRADWTAGARDSYTFQGEFNDGTSGSPRRGLMSISPITYGDITKTDIKGGHLLGQWSRSSGTGREMSLKFYYDERSRQDAAFGIRQKLADLEWQNRFALGSRHDLVWGLGYRYLTDRTKNSFLVAFEPDHGSYNLFNAFIQDEISLVPGQLSLTLGTKVEYSGYSGGEVAPNVRLLWTPSRNQSVWGAVSQAARTPSRADMGLAVRYAAFRGQGGITNVLGVLGNPDIQSETIRSHEIGYRIQPAKRLSLDIASFYATYKNLIGEEPGRPFFVNDPVRHLLIPTVMKNSLWGETYGTEIATNFDVTHRLRLNTGYSLLRVQEHRAPGNLTPEEDEGLAPRHQWFVRSSFQLPRNFELDGTFYRAGRLYTLNTPAYSRVDLRFGWRLGENLDFSVIGQNLSNSRHAEFGTADGITATEIRRSVYGKLTWHF